MGALKSCGAPPPSTMLKPYIRVADSKGRLQARGTMCAQIHSQDNKQSIRSIPTDNRPPKSLPKRRRWKANKKPPEPPKKLVQRPLMINLSGALTSASSKNLPRLPKSRPPLRNNQVG